MSESLREKILATPARKITVSVIALAVFFVGASLLYDNLRPINPPKMQEASTEDAVDFLCGDYRRLSKTHQRRFMRDLAAWYLREDSQTRLEFEQSWKKADMPKNIKSRINLQVRIASVHQFASQYATLKPQDKKQYLAQATFLIKTIPSNTSLEKLLSADRWDRIIKNPLKYGQKMDRVGQEVGRNSTAEQRAQFMKFCNDLAAYNGLR